MNNQKIALVIPFIFTSCSDITMLGHVAAYDVNAEFKGTPVTPVSMNAGFESHSFAAVPHAHSLTPGGYAKSDFLPVGDVLSTISRLKIQTIPSGDALNNVAFDFVSSGATGDAAIAAAGGQIDSTSTNLADAKKADGLAKKIEDITTDANSIKIR